MSVPLYFDHNISPRIARGLRARHVDVLTTRDDGTARLQDELLLQRATELGRALFTEDDDLLRISGLWLRVGRTFTGLVYAPHRRLPIGRAIDDLELISLSQEPEAMLNRIIYLPL